MRTIMLGFCTLLMFVIPAHAEEPPSAQSILDAMAAKYNKSPGLLVTYDIVIPSDGTPDAVKFRTEAHFEGQKVRIKTSGSQIITDGKTIWTYTADTNTVYITDYELSDQSNFLNPFSCALCAQFFNLSPVETTVFNGAPHYTFELQPKKSAPDFEPLRLFVDKKDLSISGWKVGMPSEQVTITIISVKPRDKMPARHFLYDRSQFPGVEEIDTRDRK